MGRKSLPVARFVLMIAAQLAIGFQATSAPPIQPRPPAAERATFRLADPGLSIELAAAEPQVTSPVAIAWDEDGFLFVAEMIDYPSAAPSGRIRRLEDRDGDGVYERSVVFAEGFSLPNGVLPVGSGGVLVTSAPDILLLADRDGDGRAEIRRVVLTGFGRGNPQLRVNGLYRGLDNWIYAANGRSDGDVRRPDDPPAKAISIRHRDIRFRLGPGGKVTKVEAIAGFSQFGIAHDDLGNRFPSWNTNPIRHVVLEQAALERNPYLAETTSIAEILDLSDGGRVFGIGPVQARYNKESVAYFNATCGPHVYRGDRLGPGYRGNVFVCESLSNLVHRRALEPAGATFVARRADAGREFLAATDPAFRPVNVTTGPDGALYVVDMYRELVEHPDFVPADLRPAIEFRRWHDRGRIWRIRSATSSMARDEIAARRPRLGRASAEELVAALEHPVGWWRDTAQRILGEKGEGRAVPLLRARLEDPRPGLARLHALWDLEQLGCLEQASLDRALRDPDASLREQSLHLAFEDKQAGRSIPESTLARLSADPSLRVRILTALVLGDRGGGDPQALRLMARLARQGAGDRWLRIAVLSGVGEGALAWIGTLMEDPAGWLESPSDDLIELMAGAASIVGVRKRPEEITAFIELITDRLAREPRGKDVAVGPLSLLAGLARGLERSGRSLHSWLAELAPKFSRRTALELGLFESGAAVLAVGAGPPERRLIGLELLVHGWPESGARSVATILSSARSQPPIVQTAAVRAAVRLGRSEELGRLLSVFWGELALTARRELLSGLASEPKLVPVLVHALEEADIGAQEIEPTVRESLLRLPDLALRGQIERLLARSAPADRSTALARYQDALKLAGDPRRGTGLFAKNCQTCHQYRGQGHRVGPDLSGIAGRAPAILLGNILDPNREVEPDYVALTIATTDGRVVSGLLAGETVNSFKLRLAEGVEETLLRSQVAELRSTGRSLMPEGLEQALNPQEMADLLAFLRHGDPLAGPSSGRIGR